MERHGPRVRPHQKIIFGLGLEFVQKALVDRQRAGGGEGTGDEGRTSNPHACNWSAIKFSECPMIFCTRSSVFSNIFVTTASSSSRLPTIISAVRKSAKS